jgi:hypothetical protein
MGNREGEGAQRTSWFSEALIVSAALAIPWGVVGALLRSRPTLAFYLGLTSGALCVWMVRPKGRRTRDVVYLYIFVLLLRWVLGPSYMH